MTCRDVERFLADRFSGDGPEDLPEALGEHLAACDGCRREVELDGALDEVAQGMREAAREAPSAAEIVARLPIGSPAGRASRWPLAAASVFAVSTAGLGIWIAAHSSPGVADDAAARVAEIAQLRADLAAAQGETEPGEDPSVSEYRDAMERAKHTASAAIADNQRLQDELARREEYIADLTDELNEYKSKIEHLRAQGIDVARLAETKVPAPLDGKIVAVHTGVGLVMVNLGEKHGAGKGMNFTVYRGDQYVGQVIVEEVFPDMASARIDTRFQKQEVREGDEVTTRIR